MRRKPLRYEPTTYCISCPELRLYIASNPAAQLYFKQRFCEKQCLHCDAAKKQGSDSKDYSKILIAFRQMDFETYLWNCEDWNDWKLKLPQNATNILGPGQTLLQTIQGHDTYRNTWTDTTPPSRNIEERRLACRALIQNINFSPPNRLKDTKIY